MVRLPSIPKTPSHKRRSERELVTAPRVASADFVVPRVVYLSVIASAAAAAAAGPAAAAAGDAAVVVIASSWANDPLNTLKSVLGPAPASFPVSVYCQNV